MVPSKPPSLSSLQAAIQKQPSGQKRLASADPADFPPPKRTNISKSGSPAAKQVQGLSAKMAPMPGGSPPDRPMVKTPGAAAKSSPSSFVKKAPTPGPPPHANGSPPPKSPALHHDMDGTYSSVSLDDPLSATAVADLVSAIEQVPGGGKVRHVTKLAEALGQTLQIEHINHFLKTLRKKVAQRATADGVQVPSEKTARAANAAKAAAAAKTAAAASPVSTVVKAAAKAKGAQTPKTPSQTPPSHPPVKAPPNGASAVKSPAAVTKLPPTKSPPSKAKSASFSEPVLPNGGTPAPFGKGGSSGPPPASPPPASPAPEGSPPPLDGDPLYLLAGELATDPVTDDDGNLKPSRFEDVLKRLWDGVAKKPKDWVAAWLAMVLPVERQAEALRRFLNMAFVRTEDPEKAPAIVAELVKGHRIKMKSVEDVLATFADNLDGVLALNEEAWQVYAFFLMHIYPKPKEAGWGWSRVGWSWISWWQFVEKCIINLEGSKAFDVVAMILRLIQDREGLPLAEVPIWDDGEKLSRITGKLAELGGCAPDEVVERLAEAGVATAGLV